MARNAAVAMPADQVPVCEGKTTDGLGTCQFYVDRFVLDTLSEDGPAWKLDDARFIEEAVSDPDGIFEGLNRLEMETAVAYSVRPTHDPDEPDQDGPPCYGRAFVVYARQGVGGYVVFDWEWREEDEEPGHPAGWQDDFTRRTWKT